MPGSVNCSSIDAPAWQALTGNAADGHTISIFSGATNTLLNLYDQCYALLNQTEQTAAARYHQATDRNRYVIRHGMLRSLLSKRLNIPASQLVFTHNINKKPYLSNAVDGPCFFNISHSADQFLIAISNKQLGVDIEYINPVFTWQDIAAQYFGPAERNYISQAPDQTKAFFLLWTRKEALLKACGMGIDDNLPAVPALNGLHTLPGYYPEQEWITQSFGVDNDFIASITYPAPQKQLNFVQISDEAISPLWKGSSKSLY